MSRTEIRAALAPILAAAIVLSILPSLAIATQVTSAINVAGPFSAQLNGSGTLHLQSASGNYQQGLLFGHTNASLSAAPQDVPLTFSPVNASNLPASGSINMTYDNLTPGTPESINSVGLDLNGADGSNTNIPFTVTSNSVTINVAGLANIGVIFTMNGTLSDLRFDSSTPAPVSGGVFSSSGTFSAMLGGTVTAHTSGLVNISLGTVDTVAPSLAQFSGSILGLATTSDLSPLNSPFPHTMGTLLAANLTGLSVPFAFDIPTTGNQLVNFVASPHLGNTASGITNLTVLGTIISTLNLNNPNYSLSGTTANALVPEPSSFALASLGLAGLVFCVRRRKAA
jgi:PEP-CTERM motif